MDGWMGRQMNASIARRIKWIAEGEKWKWHLSIYMAIMASNTLSRENVPGTQW